MKKLVLGAALAVAAMFVALAPAALVQAQTVTDAAAYQIDEAYVHQGAVELVAPAADSARLHEARLTAAPIPAELRDVGSRVDFTEIVASILLGLTVFVGWLVRKAFSFLPSYLQGMLLAWRVDQIVETGFNNWAERKAAEIRAKGITADLRNDALAAIVRYGRNKAPNLVSKELGGEGGLEDMVISRLDPQIDKLLERWARQKQNFAAVAEPVPVAPSPTERPASP